MKHHSFRLFAHVVVGTLVSLVSLHAGTVRFNATINGAQDGTSSTSTGVGVMLYDVTTNRFDLVVTINNFPLALTNSHVHEAAPGVAGPVTVGLGAESAYTRSGNTLTATFTNLNYAGSSATLLSGGAYLNFHTAAFPGGEIRGQLIPEPVKLAAHMTPGQETQIPAVVSNAYGASQAVYDPATNMITTLVCVYRFTNTLSNSHIHEGAVGVSGGVTLGFGGAAAYISNGSTYVQRFGPSAYPGSPVNLLSERAYVNVHSNVYAPGEIRGQLYVVNPHNAGRLVNVAARAQVGTGDNVLIGGFVVQGRDPVRVLITARGPSFASLVPGALVDPSLAIHDTSGSRLFTNDNFGTAPFQSVIAGFTAVSLTAAESGVVLVLPPGGYTSVVSGAGASTGIGLAEAFEVNW